MDRRIPAAIALVTLVALAGCSYPTTVAVTPVVEDITPGDGGEYDLTVNVTIEENSVDELTVSDVRVNAYSLDGERVCSRAYGDLSGFETRTIQCGAFPSFLVVDTPDRGKEVETGFNRPNVSILTGSELYRGRMNGSHRFEYSREAFTGDEESDPALADTRLEPGPAAYQTLQCQQWKAQASGASFDTLEDASWLEWDTRTPNRTRQYSVRITNYTRLQQANRTDRVNGNPQGNTYAASELPPRLKTRLRTYPGDGYERSSLRRSEFRPILEGLSGTDVNSTDTVGPAMQNVRGVAEEFDRAGIRCSSTPPKYDGTRGEYVGTFASYNGTTYQIQLRTEESVSGQAFENVTAP